MAYVHLEDYTGSEVKMAFTGLGTSPNFLVVYKGNPNPNIYSNDFNSRAILVAAGNNKQIACIINRNISSLSDFNGELLEADGLSYINSNYLERVTNAEIRDLITPVKWPYESDEGKKIKEDGCAYRFMLPSRSEIDSNVNDGIGELLNFYLTYGARPEWKYCDYWTRSRNGKSYYVNASEDNSPLWRSYSPNGNYYYPVFFTLPLSIWVDDSTGTLKANLPPTASFSQSNYGTVSDFPSNVSYTVSDPDGDQVTVTEKIGDQIIAKKTLQSGETGTFSVSSDQWLKVLNGQQTLKVELSDGKATGSATAKITKKVTTATVSHATGFETEELAAVSAMRLIGDIPEDAEVKIELTNNFGDDSPVWEDATAELLANRNYAFKNQTAANGNVFNFRITLSRGPSDTGGYLSGIVGTFQGADD